MTDDKLTADDHCVTSLEQKQIDRFEAAYNSIDRHIRRVLKRPNNVSFTQIAKDYASSGRLTESEYDTIRSMAALRNALVHDKIRPGFYLAVPTPYVVEQFENLRDRVLHPELVTARFLKDVTSVSVDDSLTAVLKLVSKLDYSQFPVYDGNLFRGLLTENGVTRWLAHHVSNHLSLIELDDVPVRQLLKEEENRVNFAFLPYDSLVNQVTNFFKRNELLEAVLFTRTGRRSEELLGVATRWDVLASI